MASLQLGYEARVKNIVCDTINGVSAASIGGGGAGVTIVDVPAGSAPTSTSTTSAASANSVTTSYNKAISQIPTLPTIVDVVANAAPTSTSTTSVASANSVTTSYNKAVSQIPTLPTIVDVPAGSAPTSTSTTSVASANSLTNAYNKLTNQISTATSTATLTNTGVVLLTDSYALATYNPGTAATPIALKQLKTDATVNNNNFGGSATNSVTVGNINQSTTVTGSTVSIDGGATNAHTLFNSLTDGNLNIANNLGTNGNITIGNSSGAYGNVSIGNATGLTTNIRGYNTTLQGAFTTNISGGQINMTGTANATHSILNGLNNGAINIGESSTGAQQINLGRSAGATNSITIGTQNKTAINLYGSSLTYNGSTIGTGGGSVTLVDLAANTAPTSVSTTSAATANSLTNAYNKAISLIPSSATTTTRGTVKISDTYTLNDTTVAASTTATYNLFDAATNRTTSYATNVDPGSTVTIGIDSGVVDLRGGIKVKGAAPYSTYPPTSTDATAIPSASLVTQVYSAIPTANNTFPPTTSTSDIPSMNVVKQIYDSSSAFAPGFDIIVVNGQSNGVGTAFSANGSTKDTVLDAPVSDLPIFQLTTTTTPKNSVISAVEHIETQLPSTVNNYSTDITNANTSVFTFAKLYARKYLKPGRKVLIVNNCYSSCGFSGITQTPGTNNASITPNWTPSGITTCFPNWTPNTLGSTYTYTGCVNGNLTVSTGDGSTSTNLYRLAILRTQAALNASLYQTTGIDSTDNLTGGTNQVVAIIYQGSEADSGANVSQTQWETVMGSFIDGFRSICGANVPFIVGGFTNWFYTGQTGTNASGAAYFKTMFQKFATLSSIKSFTGYADSQSPSIAGNDTGGHFTCSGYRVMGQRYFTSYNAALTNTANVGVVMGSGSASYVYNLSPNNFTVTITPYIAAGAPSTYAYYTCSDASGTNASLISGATNSTYVYTATPSTIQYIKAVAYNAFNSVPYPSNVITATVPTAPSPTLGTVTVTNVTAKTYFIQAPSSTYFVGSEVVTLNTTVGTGGTAGTGYTYSPTTLNVTNLLAGITVTMTGASAAFSSTNNNQVVVSVANNPAGLTVSPQTITFLLPANPVPAANLDVQLTFSATAASQAITLSDFVSGNTQKTLTYSGAGIAGMYAAIADSTRGYVLRPYDGTATLRAGMMAVSGYSLASTFTKMAWIKGDFANNIVGTTQTYMQIIGDATGTKHYLYWDKPSSTYVISAVLGTSTLTYSPPTALTNGVWYHVAQSYDGTTHKLYFNGALVQNAALTYTIGTNGVGIGQWNNATANNQTFYGVMDNVRIYSTALSDTVIGNIYTYENTNPTV